MYDKKIRSAFFVGDSITDNESYTEKFYYEHIQEQLELESVQKDATSGSCFSTKSDYGMQNRPLIIRYESIPHTDLILLFMGTNDYGHRTPLGKSSDLGDISFFGALNTILPQIKKSHPDSLFVVATPLHRHHHTLSGTDSPWDNQPNHLGFVLADYVNAMKAVCAKEEIPVIDLFTLFPLDPANEEVRTTYMPDGLHPNTKAHKIMGDIMAKELQAILFEQ